jgi:hypothetical protein
MFIIVICCYLSLPKVRCKQMHCRWQWLFNFKLNMNCELKYFVYSLRLGFPFRKAMSACIKYIYMCSVTYCHNGFEAKESKKRELSIFFLQQFFSKVLKWKAFVCHWALFGSIGSTIVRSTNVVLSWLSTMMTVFVLERG